MEDGTGGCYIVWRDYRNGAPDIYLQRLNKNGVALWTINGVAACTNTADQSTPSIVSDMRGGCIIAWSDWRSFVERDLYAQRVDSNGNMMWTIDGVVVTNKPEREHSERMCSDGAGGAIVCWEQQSNVDFSWGVWCQRIDSSGNQIWQSGGETVCTNPAQRRNNRIQGDGHGGAFITFQDLRNGFDYDIYVQHISSTGQYLWGGNAIKVCGAIGAQTDPKIDPEPSIGGCFLVWIDKRNGLDYDIYAQKVDSNGNCIWQNDGKPVVTAPGNQTAQDFCSNGGVNGLIAVWKDDRNGNYDIYGQRLDRDGNIQWANNGEIVCKKPNDQLNPNIIPDTTGGALIVWSDFRNGIDWNIMAQRFDSSGNMLWQPNGVSVSIADLNQTAPKNCSDGNGGTIICFQDTRNGNTDIYAQHLFADGSLNSINHIAGSYSALVFPNPFENQVHLIDQYNYKAYSIEDLMGKIIHSGTALNGTDLSGLAAGTYILTLTNQENQLIVQKIVKE